MQLLFSFVPLQQTPLTIAFGTSGFMMPLFNIKGAINR
jgi:hypothetical protein